MILFDLFLTDMTYTVNEDILVIEITDVVSTGEFVNNRF